jgi:hypothetical protein
MGEGTDEIMTDAAAVLAAHNVYYEHRLAVQARVRLGKEIPRAQGEPRPAWLPSEPTELDCAAAAARLRALSNPYDSGWGETDADVLIAMADARARIVVAAHAFIHTTKKETDR